jgi:hypothetical protein
MEWKAFFGSPRVAFLNAQNAARDQALVHKDKDWILVSAFTSPGSCNLLISRLSFRRLPFITLVREIMLAALSTNFFGLQW